MSQSPTSGIPEQSPPVTGESALSRFFKLRMHGTTVRIEVTAGVTTFVTMAYIVFVNPQMMASAGMDHGAAFVATCLGAAIACLFMGLSLTLSLVSFFFALKILPLQQLGMTPNFDPGVMLAALLLFAPYVNSYRRFMNPDSSPVNLAWAIDNRTVGLRVPDSGPEARRVENRLAGADAQGPGL